MKRTHRYGYLRSIEALVINAFLAVSIGSAYATSVPESFWGVPRVKSEQSGTGYSVQDEQTYLLWIGFYYGKIDGTRGKQTIKAVERFQAALGASVTGRLDGEQRSVLKKRAERAQEKASFQRTIDEWTGIAVDLPKGYLIDPLIDPSNNSRVHYSGKGSSDLNISLLRIEDVRGTAKQILGVLRGVVEKKKDTKILNTSSQGDFLKLVSLEKDNLVTRVIQVKRNEARGVVISHPQDRLNIFAPIHKQVFSSLEAFHGQGLAPGERDRRAKTGEIPGFRERPNWYRSMKSSGSGSIVSYAGHVLTNFHVVEGCSRLTVNANEALLLGVDVVNDLALLSVEGFVKRTPVRFRSDHARLGEEVIVIGYPLFSQSQALNLTTGVVSARSGFRGDKRSIQITAPVQPGNSGGAVLDRDGNQIAVVVSKASAAFQVQSNAENIAWVIRGDIARDFLEEYGIEPLLVDKPPKRDKPLPDVVTRAKRYAVRVECHR